MITPLMLAFSLIKSRLIEVERLDRDQVILDNVENEEGLEESSESRRSGYFKLLGELV